MDSFNQFILSWKPDKQKLKRPYYQSIADLLEEDIQNGYLAPGTKLPPQRELAHFLDLNFTTITRAYKICAQKGLTYGVTGSGTFVAPNASRTVTISKDRSTDLIELGFIASFEQTNALVTDTLRKVAEKKHVDQFLNYNDPTGLAHQKAAALNWMRSFGLQADQDHLSIVSGAQNALAITLAGLFEPGDRIATDLYTYSNFMELAKLFHLKLVPIRGDDKGMSPEDLDRECSKVTIHGVFLMPSCSNPTTLVMPTSRKHELADVIHKHRLILIEDDMHAFLTAGIPPDYQEPMFNLLPEQTVYICGMSKSLCSGLRVAYLVYGNTLREKILQAVFNINVKTSSFDAEVITELILSGMVEKIVSRKKQLAATANALFDDFFPDERTNGHPLSYYRWLPIEDIDDPVKLENELSQRGVRIYHSNRFLSGQATSMHYLRIALSSVNTTDELKNGLHIVKQYLGQD